MMNELSRKHDEVSNNKNEKMLNSWIFSLISCLGTQSKELDLNLISNVKGSSFRLEKVVF